jgi:hypothetical protein
MVAVPADLAVTTPLELTAATEGFELFQLTDLSQSAGLVVMLNAMLLPLLIVVSGAVILIEAGAGSFFAALANGSGTHSVNTNNTIKTAVIL